jgi:hypothetical protein
MSINMKNEILPKSNIKKTGLATSSFQGSLKKPAGPGPLAIGSMNDEFASLKEAAAAVQRIRLSAQRELEMARKLRADAQRYQQEVATKARSEAHQILLHTRLATQREIEEIIRKASQEMQKVLADMRMIRITAQEELAAQRKFTDAARLCSMSLSIKEDFKKPEGKKKKQLTPAE